MSTADAPPEQAASSPAPTGRALVLGGYGTFGGHVARELVRMGVAVTIAGRNAAQARSFAEALAPSQTHAAVDVRDRAECERALAGHAVAVACSGPFSASGVALLDACLAAECHYCDITDDRAYAALVRGRSEEFAVRGLTAAWGCSSLPGISGAAALVARQGTNSPVERVRATLFIGNDNPKGAAAVASAAAQLGRPIAAPHGEIYGFRDPEVVPLPPPFGPRTVFNFDSPEYDLFGELLGAKSVSAKVGFELSLSGFVFGTLAWGAPALGRAIGSSLASFGGWLKGIGCSGGAVMSELFFADGTTRRVTAVVPEGGQRMAALPCAYVAADLCRGIILPRGAVTAYEALGARPLLDRLAADGTGIVEES